MMYDVRDVSSVSYSLTAKHLTRKSVTFKLNTFVFRFFSLQKICIFKQKDLQYGVAIAYKGAGQYLAVPLKRLYYV